MSLHGTLSLLRRYHKPLLSGAFGTLPLTPHSSSRERKYRGFQIFEKVPLLLDEIQPVEVIVDTPHCLIKPSALRSISEQVFGIFSGKTTKDSLELMLSALKLKDNKDAMRTRIPKPILRASPVTRTRVSGPLTSPSLKTWIWMTG